VFRRLVAILVLALVFGVLGCSSTPRCTVAVGTPIESLPVLQLVGHSYLAYGSDGRVVGADSCCAGGPRFPFPDGGCGEICDGQPRTDDYLLGLPYGTGACREEAAHGSGQYECFVWTLDGGVMLSSGVCVD
jgi:hypothetical protein